MGSKELFELEMGPGSLREPSVPRRQQSLTSASASVSSRKITGLDRPSLMTVIGNDAWQWHSPGNFPLQVLVSPQSTEGNARKRISLFSWFMLGISPHLHKQTAA